MIDIPIPAARKHSLPWKPVLAWLALAAVFALINFFLIYSTFPTLPKGDFFTFWLGGRMVWTGQDPYSSVDWLTAHRLYEQDWIPNPAYIYPLPLALLLAPLGLLPLGAAYVAWITLAELLVVASVWMLFSPGRDPRTRPYLLPFLLGCFLFRPLIVILRNGQIGAVLLALLALGLFLMERKKFFWAGVALAMLAVKPPLGLLLPALLGFWLLARKEWRGIAGMAAGALGLLLLGMLKDPNWVVQFVEGARLKLQQTIGYAPTVWGLAGAGCGHVSGCTIAWGWISSVALVGMLLILLAWRGRSLPPGQALALIVPVTLLVAPYLWAYDQILLILPVALFVRGMAARGRPFLAAALVMLAVSVIALALLALSDVLQLDHWSALLSILVLGMALWGLREKKNPLVLP